MNEYIQNILQKYAKNLNKSHFYTRNYAILCIKLENLTQKLQAYLKKDCKGTPFFLFIHKFLQTMKPNNQLFLLYLPIID